MRHKAIIGITFFLLVQVGGAQSPFTAGIIAGLNFSQINNDNYAGYHKLGFHGGLKVITRISPKWDFHTELLYSQKGSYSNRYGYPDQRISISYLEIPLLISIKDWYIEKNNGKSFYRTQLMGGISLGRLINKSTEGFNLSREGLPLEDYFRKNDVSLLGGVTFYVTRSIGIHARFSYGITPLSKKAIENNFKNIGGKLNTYLVTLRVLYLIQ